MYTKIHSFCAFVKGKHCVVELYNHTNQIASVWPVFGKPFNMVGLVKVIFLSISLEFELIKVILCMSYKSHIQLLHFSIIGYVLIMERIFSTKIIYYLKKKDNFPTNRVQIYIQRNFFVNEGKANNSIKCGFLNFYECIKR